MLGQPSPETSHAQAHDSLLSTQSLQVQKRLPVQENASSPKNMLGLAAPMRCDCHVRSATAQEWQGARRERSGESGVGADLMALGMLSTYCGFTVAVRSSSRMRVK